MRARVVAVEDPGAGEDRDEPPVAVGGLRGGAEIDAVVEVGEDAGRGVEVAGPSDADREPDPVAEEEGEEDADGEAEVELEEARVPDVGDEGEEQADCGEEPGEPAFA